MEQVTYVLTFGYWILSSILAIAGNTFIMYVAKASSRVQRKLGVDRISVSFIFYLSMMDFLYGLTLFVMVINNIVLIKNDTNYTIFGKPPEINALILLINFGTMNQVMNRLNVLSWTANILIILVITSHRLYVVYFPLRNIAPRTAHYIALTCLLVSTVYSLYPLITGITPSVCGDRRSFRISQICREIPENQKYGELKSEVQIGMWLYLIYYVGYVLMLTLNILLLRKASNYADRKNHSKRKPIITTLLISALFIFGWTPYMGWISVMVMLRVKVEQDLPISSAYNEVFRYLEFIGYSLYTINSWGNSIIYSYVNRRFKKCVETKGGHIAASLSQIHAMPYMVRIRSSLSGARKSLPLSTTMSHSSGSYTEPPVLDEAEEDEEEVKINFNVIGGGT